MPLSMRNPTVDAALLGRRAIVAGFASTLLPIPAAAETNDDRAANTAVVRRLLEGVQRDGDFDLFDALFAPDYVDHTPFGGFPPGRDGTRQIYRTFRAAFPDWRAEVHLQVAEGDLVSTYKTYHGTHLGPFLG